MKCDRCSQTIEAKEAREHLGAEFVRRLLYGCAVTGQNM